MAASVASHTRVCTFKPDQSAWKQLRDEDGLSGRQSPVCVLAHGRAHCCLNISTEPPHPFFFFFLIDLKIYLNVYLYSIYLSLKVDFLQRVNIF